MPGKHRKSRRRTSAATRRWVPSLAAAAVTATSLTTALTTGTTVTVSPAVELTATITPASSTAQIFASPTFYGYDYTQTYGDQQIVPFFFGPQGIVTAVRNNAGDPLGNVVLSSGWGAGQTGTALGRLRGDPVLDNVKLAILDNNTNRAGGGFWTTYWIFAPLLLTSSEPTPNDLGVPVLDVGYDFNINGNAPTYPINLLSDVNSLVAYLYGYAGQSNVQLPDEVADNLPPTGDPAELKPGTHYIVDSEGNILEEYDGLNTNITYVTFKSDRLPLVKPLLLIPGGKLVADAVEPVLTVLVAAGYKDNQPIPDDPSVPRPMGLIPVKETVTALQQLPGAVVQGVHNVQENLSSPNNLFTTSNQPSAGSTTVNTLAGNSPAPSPQASKPSVDSRTVNTLAGNSPASSTQVSKPSANPFNIPTGLKPGLAGKRPAAPSAGGTKHPLRQAINDFTSNLNNLADSITNGPKKKPSDAEAPSASPAGSAAPSSNN